MCGIVGITGKDAVQERLLTGLKTLEYRGYDSAGIATQTPKGISVCRASGKLSNLQNALAKNELEGTTGIGHTRWATHGEPSIKNAHPHQGDRLCVVHNGIIENHQALRTKLEAQGYAFKSETDTECLLHLIDSKLDHAKTLENAVREALKECEGAYAIAVLSKDHPDTLIAARQGSPLALGYGQGENFLGSDALVLQNLANEITYLEEGDLAILTPQSIHIFDKNNTPVTRPRIMPEKGQDQISKGPHKHYMIKEIFEQPETIQRTLSAYLTADKSGITLPRLPFDIQNVPKITIVACGTAYYAGAIARYWLETLLKIPVEVDIASEFRYRSPAFVDGGLCLFVSQSGETADTLAAYRHAKANNQHCISIVNVPESSLARESDAVLPTCAGPEIGVASTKAFTAQLCAFACFTLGLSKVKGTVRDEEYKSLLKDLIALPDRVREALHMEDDIIRTAEQIVDANHVLYLGRGEFFPLALEGALKLKEISYIHAEGYAAGEMKHGPIALIDKTVPVIAIAPYNELFDKTASNIQEAQARGARVFFITDKEGAQKLQPSKGTNRIIAPIPKTGWSSLVYSISIQLLAYHTARLKGTDIDQPRNLAKSVTVE